MKVPKSLPNSALEGRALARRPGNSSPSPATPLSPLRELCPRAACPSHGPAPSPFRLSVPPPKPCPSPRPLNWCPRLPRVFLRAGLAVLSPLLRTLRPAPVAAMSTGTFIVSQPLNYRGGARVDPVDASGTEKAFEPATGNWTEIRLPGPGWPGCRRHAGWVRGRVGRGLTLPRLRGAPVLGPEPSFGAFSKRLLTTDT